jgi:hypothetical protein
MIFLEYYYLFIFYKPTEISFEEMKQSLILTIIFEKSIKSPTLNLDSKKTSSI